MVLRLNREQRVYKIRLANSFLSKDRATHGRAKLLPEWPPGSAPTGAVGGSGYSVTRGHQLPKVGWLAVLQGVVPRAHHGGLS